MDSLYNAIIFVSLARDSKKLLNSIPPIYRLFHCQRFFRRFVLFKVVPLSLLLSRFLTSFYCFQNASTICLKANLEYLRGNYKKAIKLLNTSTTENVDFRYVLVCNLHATSNELFCAHGNFNDWIDFSRSDFVLFHRLVYYFVKLIVERWQSRFFSRALSSSRLTLRNHWIFVYINF